MCSAMRRLVTGAYTEETRPEGEAGVPAPADGAHHALGMLRLAETGFLLSGQSPDCGQRSLPGQGC
jgi:hypothetical protein